MKRRTLYLFIGLTFILLTNAYVGLAQTAYAKLKSAFIIQFANNITWKNESDIKTFRIGLWGNDTEIYEELAFAAKNKNVRNKPIEVVQIKKQSEIKDLQLLYVGKPEVKNISRIYPEIEKKSILLITDECNESQYVMLNLIYNSNKKSVSFEVNKANLILENFTFNPELLLLGGTEIDVRDIYREMQNHLADATKNVFEQRELLDIQKSKIDSQSSKITEQKSITDSLFKSIENLRKQINTRESDLFELNIRTKNQELILTTKSEQIIKQEAEFQLQKKKIAEWENKIEIKSKELQNLLVEIENQKNIIDKQNTMLISKETFINTQKKLFYLIIGFTAALLLLGISVFSAYRTKKRANALLEEKVAKRTKELEDEILERKQAEAEEQNIKNILTETGEIAKVGGWELDLVTGVSTWTDETYRIFEVEPTREVVDEVPEKPKGVDWYAPEFRPIIAQAVQRAIEFDEPYDLEVVLVGEKETRKWVRTTGRIIQRNGHKTLFGIMQDITERKKTELELMVAKEKAEESDRLKSAFLANMSHEIRTPMNGILGFSELLKEPGLTGQQQQEYIRIIENSGERMLNTINDIIDISRIESGIMEVSIKEININKKLENLYNFFNPEASKKEINLSLKIGLPSKDAVINTDGEKFYAILSNLIKNAIKYTNNGSLEFGYNLIEKNGLASLQFFVKDSGIGIPIDRQQAIFDRFVQADVEDILARQGSGLGLSIAKSYVEMLGGTIWVESYPEKGSTFYFTLPYRIEAEKNEQTKNSRNLAVEENQNDPQIRKLKILIAEDDETSDLLIRIRVKKFGKEIINTRTGTETVEVCRNNPDINLILMDIRMPEMNGYEATRQIRKFNKDVTIIAQTAHGLIGDREKSIEAGCNDYLSKPINNAELLTLIQKYFKQ